MEGSEVKRKPMETTTMLQIEHRGLWMKRADVASDQSVYKIQFQRKLLEGKTSKNFYTAAREALATKQTESSEFLCLLLCKINNLSCFC